MGVDITQRIDASKGQSTKACTAGVWVPIGGDQRRDQTLELVSSGPRNTKWPVSRNWKILHGALWISRCLANHEVGINFVFAVRTGALEMGAQGHDGCTRQVEPRHMNGRKGWNG